MKNTSSDVAMDRHSETMNAHHAKNPDDARAYHNYVLDSFGLSGAAKSHIVQERNAAAVAHLIRNADVRATISKLDDKSQVEALKRIRGGESSAPDPDSNEETDRYLKDRRSQRLESRY